MSRSQMKLLSRIIIAALVLAWLQPVAALAIEPWADAALPVQDGLELWLDASRAADDFQWPAGGKLAEWRDASGKKRTILQPQENARPTLIKTGSAAIVRFDGIDDHFRAIEQNTKLETFTLILVAAPRHNLGAFRALAAFNAAGERDYTSGMTIDLGPSSSAKFSSLNVEGRGFGGAQNVRNRESSFGRLQTIVVTANPESVQTAIDGHAEVSKKRDGGAVSVDQITVGARYYNNAPGPQHVDGFGATDIAEVILYNRPLEADELKRLQKYLDSKYGEIKDALPPDETQTAPLKLVENPPPVQVFVPGFSARELPVDLTNINNVLCREDGTLVALGYDGTIWLIRDSDGDGLEDKADIFFENKSGLRSPIGMDLTPPGYSHGNGVFVVGKTRCVLIVDTDGDDRADREVEVASRWKESFHQVDGLGVAYDRRDGSVYFGRGTYNFTDPLLRDKDGKPQYSLTDESGAIIRVSPDFKSHEIIATGIRFPVGLRFNAEGDLFATDQEGATWVPNGNPLDELLHIQKGRHYGFPARHPVHLPNVIDEPSTFDYSPQHQSTCGFNFNEPVRENGPIFGPDAWRGDAFVTGYSRGKVFRTQLVKTDAGYVARSQTFACLNMLPADCCITADGSMIAACHSGGPDWGSGPTGKGKLFKIRYDGRDEPQPVLAWASTPREVRVEFDRPMDPERWHDLLARSELTAGKHVRAGDRFESLSPGYALVQLQKIARRRNVPIHSAQLTADGRTLVLATDPVTSAVHYALQLPASDSDDETRDDQKSLPRHPAIDVDFGLTGCEATWLPADGSATWTGWLPHFDLDVNRRLTHGSATHDALWAAMKKPGELFLRAQLDLADMLRPAVQPGSKIDYEYPPEVVTATFETTSANAELQLTVPADSARKIDAKRASLTLPSDVKKIVPVELRLKSAGGAPTLTVSWTTNEDDRPRPFPLRRIFIPSAELQDDLDANIAATRPPELEGGSWARGYKEFFGEQAGCSKCHTIYHRGGNIGPDLSNLMHRDYASVLRDITHPSFAINPDYLSYNVILSDGRTLSGVIHTTKDGIEIGDANGLRTPIGKADIEEMSASSVSTMPEGLNKQLGEDRLRDLMTFLITPPPRMPQELAQGRPKPHTLADINAVLAGAPSPPEKTRPVHIVLVAGEKDHGPGEHDYPAWQRAWTELLAAANDVEVSTAWEWPEKAAFEKADVIVFYQHGDWNPQRAADIDAFLKRDGGLVYIHWAVDGRGREPGLAFANRIGLAAAGLIGFRHGEMTLTFNRETNHPIIRNFESLTFTDETYWHLGGNLPAKNLLATAIEESEPRPQLWTMEHGRGRVFVSIPGHYSWTFDDPLFRVLLLRGIAWTAQEPVDRFNELVWPGADVAK